MDCGPDRTGEQIPFRPRATTDFQKPARNGRSCMDWALVKTLAWCEEWSCTRTFHLWSVKRLISTDPLAACIATKFLYSNVLPHHFHCVQAECCNGAWAVSVWWPITWPITDSTGHISASLCSLPTAVRAKDASSPSVCCSAYFWVSSSKSTFCLFSSDFYHHY